MRFRSEQHLRRQRDFRAVREEGRRISCGPFTFAWLQHLANPANPAVDSSPAAAATSSAASAPSPARIGFVASAAAVGGAIQRNRAKRRLREIFRRHQSLVPAGCDVVVTARTALNHTDYAALEQKFVEACRVFSSGPGGKK